MVYDIVLKQFLSLILTFLQVLSWAVVTYVTLLGFTSAIIILSQQKDTTNEGLCETTSVTTETATTVTRLRHSEYQTEISEYPTVKYPQPTNYINPTMCFIATIGSQIKDWIYKPDVEDDVYKMSDLASCLRCTSWASHGNVSKHPGRLPSRVFPRESRNDAERKDDDQSTTKSSSVYVNEKSNFYENEWNFTRYRYDMRHFVIKRVTISFNAKY